MIDIFVNRTHFFIGGKYFYVNYKNFDEFLDLISKRFESYVHAYKVRSL